MLYKEKKKALNDNIIEVTNLCGVIEDILRHQQKGGLHDDVIVLTLLCIKLCRTCQFLG